MVAFRWGPTKAWCGDISRTQVQKKLASSPDWSGSVWETLSTDYYRSSNVAFTQNHTLRVSLAEGNSYHVRVRAVNEGLTVTSEEGVAGPPSSESLLWLGPPGSPTGLKAAPFQAAIQLTWNQQASGQKVTGWDVRRKEGAGSYGEWGRITGSGANTVLHSASGLTSGVDYTFQIRAVNAAGDGRASEEVTETPTGVTISQPALTVEEGSSSTYTVVLDAEPSADVTVTVGGAAAGVSVNPPSLVFSLLNWNQPQTVTVSAAEDDNAVSEPVTLTHRASGGGLDSVPIRAVVVTVTENETAGFALSESDLELEEGESGSWTVALTSEPTADVTVTISGAPSGVTVTPPTLTFTAADWQTPQAVTVATVDDEDAAPLPAGDAGPTVRPAATTARSPPRLR